MFEIEDKERLTRIETRLVKFAEEMGIGVGAAREHVTVDSTEKVIYIGDRRRSVFDMQDEARRCGATPGDRCKVFFKNRDIGELEV